MKRILVKSIIYRSILGIFSLSALTFFIGGEFGLKRHYQVRTELSEKRQLLLALANEVKEIKQKIAQWKSDPFYLEKMAREELGMGRRSERVYLYTTQKESPVLAQTVKLSALR